jgi:hypothetical protein
MLKIKKGLANILENNNNGQEEAPQPPQPPQSVALKLNEQEAAPQASQLLRSVEPAVQPPQPPASTPRQAEDWGELLIKLLASAPEDVAQKLTACIDREVLLKVLEKRNDPYLKVALLLLTKK